MNAEVKPSTNVTGLWANAAADRVPTEARFGPTCGDWAGTKPMVEKPFGS